jgi:hypothetical protein
VIEMPMQVASVDSHGSSLLHSAIRIGCAKSNLSTERFDSRYCSRYVGVGFADLISDAKIPEFARIS